MSAEKSKGMIEAEISEAIIKFEKEYMGRGPTETRTYIIHDMIIVRLKGVLSKAEKNLTSKPDGVELIKKIRLKLLEELKPEIEAIIKEITGYAPVGMHTDISTVSGERIIVWTLETNLEEYFRINK